MAEPLARLKLWAAAGRREAAAAALRALRSQYAAQAAVAHQDNWRILEAQMQALRKLAE